MNHRSTSIPYDERELRELSELLLKLKIKEYDSELPHWLDEHNFLQPSTALLISSARDYIDSVDSEGAALQHHAAERIRSELTALADLILPKLNDRGRGGRRTASQKSDRGTKVLSRPPARFFEKLDRLSFDAHNLVGLAALSDRKEIGELMHELRKGRLEAIRRFLRYLTQAIRYLDKQHGPRVDVNLIDFVHDLCDIYKHATGRKPTHSYKAADPEYQGPCERFIFGCLKPVRRSTSLDSVRGLIRKAKRRPAIVKAG